VKVRDVKANFVPATFWIGFDTEYEFNPLTGQNDVLSYQLVLKNPETGAYCKLLVEPTGYTKKHRLSLKHLLQEIIYKAVKEGVVEAPVARPKPKKPPKPSDKPKLPPPDFNIIVGCHFSRADICGCSDFEQIKSKFDSVRKTYATTTKPIRWMFGTQNGGLHASIRLVDIGLLAPAKSRLADLGDAIGKPKIVLPEGVIERMKAYQRDHHDDFADYAVNDAVVTVDYLQAIFEILKEEFGITKIVPTLGAGAVDMILREVVKAGSTPEAFFGQKRNKLGKVIPNKIIAEPWVFAASCYHGGLNSAYVVGYSPEGVTLYDWDFVQAYTTMMCMIKIPDWDFCADPIRNGAQTCDIKRLAVISEAMTFAKVVFHFPPGTRFPSLPVRTGPHGLYYPMSGVSWCCGPELVVALAQGAHIKVLNGWRIDWIENSKSPFENYTRNVYKTRMKYPKGTLQNTAAKELGNSGYGKVAQAVDGDRIELDDEIGAYMRKLFDSREGALKAIEGSAITNAMMAAYITSGVRAGVAEQLARMSADEFVVSATTDGFLTSASKLDLRGPVAQAFQAVRSRISPSDDNILELKHKIPRALSFKTRGCVTVGACDKPVIARAGYRLRVKPNDPNEESAEWIKLHAERDYETKMPSKHFIPQRAQWKENSDLTMVHKEIRLNLDFDMKRRLINVRDVESVLTAETVPWLNTEEAEQARNDLDDWKENHHRVLKTAQDYRDWRTWAKTRESRKASGLNATTGRPEIVDVSKPRARPKGSASTASAPRPISSRSSDVRGPGMRRRRILPVNSARSGRVARTRPRPSSSTRRSCSPRSGTSCRRRCGWFARAGVSSAAAST
jgi:hypothetical protein